MIISHRLKFAFFANQRTGSKAVGIFLRFCGVFDENDIMIAQPFPATRTARIEIPSYNLGEISNAVATHMTPQKAIDAGFITLEQLREYDCYAFLRRPYDRFMAIRASMQVNRNGMFARPGQRLAGVATPQYEFFYVGDEQVVTPLDFDNYHEELKMLAEKLGAIRHMDVPEIVAEVPARMPTKVHYDVAANLKEESMYRRMMNEIQNRKT